MSIDNTQSILIVDSQLTLHKAIIKVYNDLQKYKRFKVGCKPSDCEISDLNYLTTILCSDECHITEKEIQIILEKIQNYG